MLSIVGGGDPPEPPWEYLSHIEGGDVPELSPDSALILAGFQLADSAGSC